MFNALDGILHISQAAWGSKPAIEYEHNGVLPWIRFRCA